MTGRAGDVELLQTPRVYGVDGDDATGRPSFLETVADPAGPPDGGVGGEAQMRFRKAFDHAPIGMALVGVDGRWLDVNGALCAKLGYEGDELVRLRWQDLTHPDDLEADEHLLASLLIGDRDCASREKRFITSNGAEIWVQLNVSVIRRGSGAGDYFIQQIQDISVQKYAEKVSEQQAFMFDALNEAAMVTDARGHLTGWNRSAQLMFNLSSSALEGYSLSTLMLEHDGESSSSLLAALCDTGRWRGELGIRLTDGNVGVAEITAAAIGGPHGRRRSFAIVARDITERSAAERRIRDHNRRLGTLLNIQHLIARVGPNRAAIQRLVVERVLDLVPCDGAAVALPEGDGMLSVVATSRRGRAQELSVPAHTTPAGVCIEEGRMIELPNTTWTSWPRHSEQELVECRSAVYIPLLHDGLAAGALVVVSSEPDPFERGDLDAMKLMAGALAAALSHAARFEENQDLVTERSRALTALQVVEQRFRALIEHARDMVVVLSIEGKMEYVSPAVTPGLGYEPEELIGLSARQFVHPDDLDALRAQQDRILARAGRIGSFDFRFRHRDGSWRQLAGRATNQVDNSALGGMVLNIQDVTESRLMEEQLRRSQKLEAIGQLAAGIAHEINTPSQYVGDNVRFLDTAFRDLMALLERYQVARRDIGRHPEFAALSASLESADELADLAYLTEEIPAALTQSLDGLERIAEIVRSVRAFSHPGGDSKAAADLNREIENTVAVSRNEWKYYAEVELHLAPALPPVRCLVSEINQALLNLIVNAAHAIGENRTVDRDGAQGLITITTQQCHDTVEITIQDTGCGIPEKLRSRVFDPFFTTKEVGRGTGQGLAIARTVVTEKHRGTIDFKTELGVGTTFTIRLPIDDQVDDSAGDS